MTKGTSKGGSKGSSKRKSVGHSYGNCSKKRALIKARVHRLETELVELREACIELMTRLIHQERLNEADVVNSTTLLENDPSQATLSQWFRDTKPAPE